MANSSSVSPTRCPFYVATAYNHEFSAVKFQGGQDQAYMQRNYDRVTHFKFESYGRVGDFSWPDCGHDLAIFNEAVAHKLEMFISGIYSRPVTCVAENKKKIVEKRWLLVRPLVGVSVDWSLTKHSHASGKRVLSGMEEVVFPAPGLDQKDETEKPVYRRKPRKVGHGFQIHETELSGNHLFNLLHLGTDPICCTALFKQHVEALGLTNIEFLEIGDVV